MSAVAIHASADPKIDFLPREGHRSREAPRFHWVWKRVGQLTGKVLLVALTIAALAVAAYFTFGAAFAVGAAGSFFGLGKPLFIASGMGLGIAALFAPVLAFVSRMFSVTEDNSEDCYQFLKMVFFTACIATIAFAYKHFHGDDGAASAGLM